MKYCFKCGTQVDDEAVFCPSCGTRLERDETYYAESNNKSNASNNNALRSIALAFMIIATVAGGFFIIPLAWMLPMTLKYNDAIKNNRKVSTTFKVCTILFVSLVSGILMLCDDE